MNYYQFHIADWALHTSHLTLEEEAVYRRLLDYYYDTESPIPSETQPVFRRLRLRGYEEIASDILCEFFVLEGDGWHNKRADSEIEAYQAKANQARLNGKRGGRPKKNNGLQKENPEKTQPVISGNPEKSKSKANQEPRTKNQEPYINTMATGVAVVDGYRAEDLFEQFWHEYPRKTGKQSAEKAFKKLKPTMELTCTLIADCRLRVDQGQWSLDDKQFIPHAATYLNGKRWRDEVVPRSGAALSQSSVAKKTQNIIEKLNSEESWLCNL